MSYRGSFVSEFVTCAKCHSALAAALKAEPALCVAQPADYPRSAPGPLPIFAGYLNSSASELQHEWLAEAVRDAELCHEVAFAVVHEGGRVSRWRFDPELGFMVEENSP